MASLKDWLGNDTSCPIEGRFTPIQGIDEVNQCIQLLIATIPGERVMRPEYGCRLYSRIWDNLDSVASEGLKDIRDAIDNYEPRIDLVSVGSKISRDEGLVVFFIQYKIKDENTIENLVFPFKAQLTE